MEVRNGSYVARTILHQLGGPGRLKAMLGARNFLLDKDALEFSIPSNFAKHSINRLRIRLNWNDLYVVTFSRVRAGKTKVLGEFSDIYADTLKNVIERETGLYLSL